MCVTAISPQRLAELCKAGRIDLIDVRTPVEFREVHVEHARNVPLDRLDPAARPGGDTVSRAVRSAARVKGFPPRHPAGRDTVPGVVRNAACVKGFPPRRATYLQEAMEAAKYAYVLGGHLWW
jgi:rhodanese-related sulfurtransferase